MPDYKGVVFKSAKDEETREVARYTLQPDGSARLSPADSFVGTMIGEEAEVPEWADDDINEELPGDWEPGKRITPKNGAAFLKYVLWSYGRGRVWAEPLFE